VIIGSFVFLTKTAVFFPLKAILLFPVPLSEIRKLELPDLTFIAAIEDPEFEVKIALALSERRNEIPRTYPKIAFLSVSADRLTVEFIPHQFSAQNFVCRAV